MTFTSYAKSPESITNWL